MSLPPAKKDISEHPAKDAVTAPVDKILKDEDVSRKIRLYGAIEAFRKGRLPSNKQIDSSLRYVRDNPPVNIDQLSPDGKKLIHDIQDILNTTGLIVQEKNADELLQNFVWHTHDIEKETMKPGDVTQHLPDRDTVTADNEQAVRHLRTLFHIVLTNSEARKLLSDFSVIGRDLLSKSAIKAAETLAPGEEALQRVDEAGPHAQFVSEGGKRVGPDQTPVLEARLPATDTTIRRHPQEDQTFVHSASGERRPVSDVKNEGKARVGDVLNDGLKAGEDRMGQAQEHAEDIRSSDEPTQGARAKKTGLMGKMKGVTQNLTDRIPSQHKDRVREEYDHGRHYLAEEYFPQERREQFIYRGKKVIVECQQHEDYKQSLEWLLDYIEKYAKHGRRAAGAHGTAAQNTVSESKIDRVIGEVRTLLERFANNTSLDQIIDAANVLIDDSRRDPELRDWFKSADAYIRRVLLEPGYVLNSACRDDGSQIRETGRRFYDEKYRSEFDNLFQTVSAWFNAMGEDPLNKRFGEDWARLTKDLLFDDEGSLKFKPQLWSDIRKVILPQVIEKVGYIPIPRIEYTDDALDLVVENLALQGRNLLPNIISLEANNYIKFSPYNAITDDNHHRITLTLEQMQADMRDVAFYYRTKSGLKMSDSGMADVLLGGRGLNATIVLHSTTRDKSSVFKVQDVHVKVDSLKFSIRESKHDFLYKTIKPLATGLVKRQITKAIKDALTTGLEYIDGQLVVVRDRMETAKRTEGESRTEVLKSMFHHKKEETASQKKGEKTSQFKIVSNKRDSLLAQGHPKGWVHLTEEREKAAVHGAEWRSDAFDLVEAQRSDTSPNTMPGRSGQPATTGNSRIVEGLNGHTAQGQGQTRELKGVAGTKSQPGLPPPVAPSTVPGLQQPAGRPVN